MAKENIILLGCGDVGPAREPIEIYSTLARPILATGDIRFVQCESLYSDRGSLQVSGTVSAHARVKPHMASVFSDCGIDVVSVAGNHGMDWGEHALLDTIALLQKMGIQTVGAGRNLQEARQPAIIERHGVRVAFLAYCSVLQHGYEASPSKVGIAPLRAHTYYEPAEYQAGLPPRVITVPYEEDLEGMLEDIAKAKKTAHIVVVSLHWGIHHIPKLIADYQPITAKAAFGAGADLILGHHTHVPKAIGIHSGKACFYGLGNFIMSTARRKPYIDPRAQHYGLIMDPNNPPDALRSVIAKAVLSREGVNKVSFMPVLIDEQYRPEVLRHGDPRFDDMVRYMEWVSDAFDHKFTVEGNEITVEG